MAPSESSSSVWIKKIPKWSPFEQCDTCWDVARYGPNQNIWFEPVSKQTCFSFSSLDISEMEDSGFDSEDVKIFERTDKTMHLKTPVILDNEAEQTLLHDTRNNKPTRNMALLQKKHEKRLEQAKKLHPASNLVEQPRKSLIPINRLHVPNKPVPPMRDGAEQPLVMWQTDSSDEDFEFNSEEYRANESTKPLQKDLDLDAILPDEDDLDLIPPRPFQQRCICCQLSTLTCNIQ